MFVAIPVVRRLAALLALLIAPLTAQAAQAAPDCAALGRGQVIGHATVLFAAPVAAGAYRDAGGKPIADLPAFCRVVARAAPSPASNITIEVWLPLASGWNGKFLGTGNGGFAGALRPQALAGGLRRGYAVANTDMGTYPAAEPGVGYEAGNGRPDAVRDWGYRATHEMTLLGRAMVDRFYGRPATRRYFAGCSTGGHQGLTEAQRFPDDYDAILAGAPGHNRTHLHAMFAWISLAARAPGATLPPAALSLWSTAMLKACAGRDGGAPGDAFLTDPTQCGFAPRALRCAPGAASGSCLTDAQIGYLDKIYGGTRNPRTGALIYPPEVRGTGALIYPPEVRGIEALLKLVASRPVEALQPVPSDLSRWVFGPRWDAASFDFDRDMTREDDALAGEVNANDPDLSRFVAHGGKLIMFHGWADGVVSPIDTVLYYDRLVAAGHAKADYARLFMAPGMSHCAGGDGPDLFGQGAEYTPVAADGDLLAALDTWSTTGVAPDHLVAYRRETETPFGNEPPRGPVIAARPLCAYPRIARFRGGDSKRAESFACSAAAPARYEVPGKQYLR